MKIELWAGAPSRGASRPPLPVRERSEVRGRTTSVIRSDVEAATQPRKAFGARPGFQSHCQGFH